MARSEPLLVGVDPEGEERDQREEGREHRAGREAQRGHPSGSEPPSDLGVPRGEDPHNLAGQTCVAARPTGGQGQSLAQTVEKVRPGPRAGHRGPGSGHVRQRVGVAASHAGHPRRTPDPAGRLVVPAGHRAVEGLDQRQPPQGQAQVGELAVTGQRGEEVIHGRRDALLREVGEESLGVSSSCLDGHVLGLGDVEHVDVELPAPGQEDRHLLADERVGPGGEEERALDAVVVGEGDEIHAPAHGLLVDVRGIGVAFPPDVLEDGNVGTARVPGMNVQVATHHLCILAIMGPSTSSASRARDH